MTLSGKYSVSSFGILLALCGTEVPNHSLKKKGFNIAILDISLLGQKLGSHSLAPVWHCLWHPKCLIALKKKFF